MDKYYYFACQLPFLQFGESINMSREIFLEEAEKWLDQKDFSLLRKTDIDSFDKGENRKKDSDDYREFEADLRGELARSRKASGEGRDYKLPGVLSKIIGEGNPLEIEKKLLHHRWKFIEEKEEGHYFDLGFFIIYFLKLQILEKLFTFNKEKGMIAFDKLCEVHPVGDGSLLGERL